jgi:arabinose-5-phosphate isomerase
VVDTSAINILNIASAVFQDEMSGMTQVLGALAKPDSKFVDIVNLLLKCNGKVVVTGIGKSGHIANKIAATFSSTGTPAFFMHPAEALHGDLGMIGANDIVIAISYSGEADELITMMPILKRIGVPIIGITGNLNSTLARNANFVLSIAIAKEACPLNLAPTTSTTVTLVLGDAIAVCLLTLRGFKPEDFALSHPGGSLGRRLILTARDLMRSGEALPWVLGHDNIKHVIVEISKKGLGFVAVVDDSGQLLGSITDGDLRRAFDRDIDLSKTIATEIMNATPKTIKPDGLAVDAIELMDAYRITGLLVVDENNNLIGAFNLHDLFKAKLI